MNTKQSFYLFVAIAAIFAGPSLVRGADAVPTPPPAETTSIVAQVEATATNVVVAATNEAVTTVTKSTVQNLKDGASAAVDSLKTGTAEAVASVKETVNDIAPPKVRGEFMSLVLEKIKKYSAAGEEAVGKAIDEIQEQTPIIVKEYLRWHLAENLFYIAVTLIGFTAVFVTFWKTFPKWLLSLTEPTEKHKTTEVDVRQFKYGASGILSGISSLVILWIILAHLEWYLNSIKIIIAPRVYLLEQVATFIRQVSGS